MLYTVSDEISAPFYYVLLEISDFT